MYEFPNMNPTNFEDVGRFHRKFGLPSVSHEGVGPREVDSELLAFRVRFLHEELEEYEDAIAENNPAKAFDALLDLVYVAMGDAHHWGFPWQRGWELVQIANMQKQRSTSESTDSDRGNMWDIVKPAGWTPPDIEGLLFNSGWFAEPGETLPGIDIRMGESYAQLQSGRGSIVQSIGTLDHNYENSEPLQ